MLSEFESVLIISGGSGEVSNEPPSVDPRSRQVDGMLVDDPNHSRPLDVMAGQCSLLMEPAADPVPIEEGLSRQHIQVIIPGYSLSHYIVMGECRG